MSIVIIPVLFLIIIAVFKKIPLVGGNIIVAFIGAGSLALLTGGIFDPTIWVNAFVTGLNRIAFIIMLIIFGTFFSNLQIKTGALDTVLGIMKAKFGKTAQGLIFASLITLYFGGAVVGTVGAVALVLGVLVVPAMDDIGVPPDMICAIIVTGGSVGALMPPISNAVFVAAGALDIDPNPVVQISYVTVAICATFVTWFVCKIYIGKKYEIDPSTMPTKTAWQVFSENKKSLLPVSVLIVLVLLNSLPFIKFDILKYLMNLIPMGELTLYTWFVKIPIIGQLTNYVVYSLIVACIVTIVAFPDIRKQFTAMVSKTSKEIGWNVAVQLCAGFFLGAFSTGGQMEAIAVWATSLSADSLKIGGAVALILGGMIMGTQSHPQVMFTPILGPALIANGVDPVNIAVASSHLAAAGQGLPPADLNTFFVAAFIGSLIGKKVDPMKSMFYTMAYCIPFALMGFVFLYI